LSALLICPQCGKSGLVQIRHEAGVSALHVVCGGCNAEFAWEPEAGIVPHAVVMAYEQTADIEPVLAAVPFSPVTQALRRLIIHMHEQAHPLGVKTPRDGRANYVAANLTGVLLRRWLAEHPLKNGRPRKNVTKAVREEKIDDVIKDMKSWHATKQGRWPDVLNRDRVLALLRLAKGSRERPPL
jgi:hypothetical protein